MTFILGTMAYIYIAYGAFGKTSCYAAIINRVPQIKSPQIITDYFHHGQWQMMAIEVIYMGHMVTAFPNFLIVSKYLTLDILESVSSRCSK